MNVPDTVVSDQSCPHKSLRAFLYFLLVLSFLSAVFLAVPRLAAEWQRNPAGEHVFLVMAVAVVLFFKEWRSAADSSRLSEVGQRRLFVVLLLFSCICLVADAFFEEEFLLAAGVWLCLPVFAGLFCAPAIPGKIAFPALLLVFCLPLPSYVAFHFLHYPLQRISTAWTAGMLATSGLDAWFAGTVVHVGAESLQVVEECSGVRFLTALSFLALLLGFLRLRCHPLLRTLVFLMAFPLAVLTNVLRLTIAGEIMARRGVETAVKFIHSDWVLVFYLAAILFLVAFVKLLAEIAAQYEISAADLTDTPAISAVKIPFFRSHISSKSLLFATAWLVLVSLGSIIATRQAPVGVARPGLQKLNLCPPGWHEIAITSGALDEVFTPNLFSAVQHRQIFFESPQGLQAKIEIAWWPGRRPRNRLVVFHQSVICPEGRYGSAFHFDQIFSGTSVAGSIVETDSGPVTLYYWLQSPGIISKSPFWHAAWQYWLELQNLPADGCFIMVAVLDHSSGQAHHLSDLIVCLQGTLKEWLLLSDAK
ncbi:MAG: exosortase/archaeosortase family protein [Candidatus Riflebacteria bacterium]|nr:exosortase/archaeosortase family protein [Candidatus Riflebacteria bacterium]